MPGHPMRCFLFLLFVLLLPAAAASAALEQHDVFADVVVSPEGEITEFSVDERFKAMEQTLHVIAAKWRFQPVLQAGQPAAVHTTLWLRLHLDRNPAGATARLEYVSNGSNAQRMMQPRFPSDALREGSSGIVLLEVSHDAEGRVTNVRVDSSLASRQRDRKAFEVAAMQAAGAWVLKPQRINGVGMPGRVKVPVWFQNHGRDPMPELPPLPANIPSVEDGRLLLQFDPPLAAPAAIG